MPSLEQQAETARKLVQEHKANKRTPGSDRETRRRILPMQRDTLVLWCMYNGWGRAVSAERTGLGANTIRRAMERFRIEPWLIFRVPVLHRGMFGRKPLWRCEVCLARLPGISELRARTHVAQHLISLNDIQMNEVVNPWGD